MRKMFSPSGFTALFTGKMTKLSHLKKCSFTFSENVTNYALIVDVQNVNKERKTFVPALLLGDFWGGGLFSKTIMSIKK